MCSTQPSVYKSTIEAVGVCGGINSCLEKVKKSSESASAGFPYQRTILSTYGKKPVHLRRFLKHKCTHPATGFKKLLKGLMRLKTSQECKTAQIHNSEPIFYVSSLSSLIDSVMGSVMGLSMDSGMA